MKPLLIIAAALLTTALSAAVRTGSIEGTVIDRLTRQPLVGATVILVGTQTGASADANGRFVIKDVPVGVYQAEASMIGYRPLMKTEVAVSAKRVTTLNFKLSQAALTIGVVEVRPDYFEKDADKPISAKILTPQEILSSAGSGGDVFRVVQAMPGVASVGGKSANLVVRGGSPDENRTLLDDIEIYNPLHFSRPGSSMGGGVISIINPALLNGVEFLTGGFPAEYGDKMSSVFEMSLHRGNRTRFNTDVNLNMTGFGVLLDSPLPGNGTMICSARRGYFDLITSLMGRPVSVNYWDAVGKAAYDLGGHHTLSLVGFYFADDVERTGEMSDAGVPMAKYEYMKFNDYGSAVGVNWRYLFPANGYVLTTLALTGNSWNSGVGTEADPDLLGEDVLENELYVKTQAVYVLSDAIEIKAGVIGKGINSDYFTWRCEDTTRTGVIIPADTADYDPELGLKAGSFLQTTLRPFGRLSLNAGLRYDYFSLTGENKLSPRIAASYALTDATSLNAAWGYYYQTPLPYQMAINSAETVTGLESSQAVHYIAGVEQLFGKDIKVSVEGYYKEYDNLLILEDTVAGVRSNAGSGEAYGVEFYLQKKMSKNLVGSVAYTWSQARRRDADTADWYYSDFDQTHNLTFLAGYKLGENWQLGAKFAYATGSPYTPIVDAVQQGENWYLVEGERNSERYPAYHRLDIRIDRYFHFDAWTLSVYLDVWNVYYRDNVTSYRFDVDAAGAITQEAAYDFPLLPIFGISAKF